MVLFLWQAGSRAGAAAGRRGARGWRMKPAAGTVDRDAQIA
jgi:hypothetical protein